MSDENKRKKGSEKDNALRKRLPLACVAMTRTTHFICLAVHIDRYSETQRSYVENSSKWNVVYIYLILSHLC